MFCSAVFSAKSTGFVVQAIINASCHLIVNSWICIFLGVVSQSRSAWIDISKPYPHVRSGFVNPLRSKLSRFCLHCPDLRRIPLDGRARSPGISIAGSAIARTIRLLDLVAQLILLEWVAT